MNADDLLRLLALARRRLDLRDAGLPPFLPGDPVPRNHGRRRS